MGARDALKESFREAFGGESRLYRAPGRVNLIGEHTDYNDGFVLPAALEQCTWVAAAARPERRLRVRSLRAGETLEFDLDDAAPTPRRDWSDYVRGVAVALARDGYRLTGADLLIDSDVPVGGGLSSSAALEVSTGYALLDCAGHAVDRTRLALCCQRAENEFVGMRCGIMDQFASCHGAADRALLIDCRSLEHPPGADRRLGPPGDLQLDGPPCARRQRIQPPPRTMRGGRGAACGDAARHPRLARRDARGSGAPRRSAVGASSCAAADMWSPRTTACCARSPRSKRATPRLSGA